MRHTKIILALSVLVGTYLLLPATAFAQETVTNGAATNGRFLSTLAAAIGLAAAVVAGRLCLRRNKPVSSRAATGTAAVSLLVVAYAAIHLRVFPGGLGTGDGRAGAYLAIAFGLVGLTIGIVVLRRRQRVR